MGGKGIYTSLNGCFDCNTMLYTIIIEEKRTKPIFFVKLSSYKRIIHGLVIIKEYRYAVPSYAVSSNPPPLPSRSPSSSSCSGYASLCGREVGGRRRYRIRLSFICFNESEWLGSMGSLRIRLTFLKEILHDYEINNIVMQVLGCLLHDESTLFVV